MSTPAATNPQADPTTSTTPTPTATGGTPTAPSAPEKTFTQAELETIISDRLSRQQRAIDAKVTADKSAAEAAKLAEQGEFKKLAETAQAERDVLKAALAQRDHLDLQKEVAQAHNLPAALASRLQGTTREELVADAKEMAKLVTAPANPNPAPAGNRPNPRPQSGPDQAQETEKMLRSTGRYNAI
jgi:hypothetical protein